MKRLIVALLSAFVFSLAASAQQADAPKMSVRSFTLAENDNTANLHGTTVIDQNGDPCALIRVQTTQTGFAWDFGQMQPCKVELKTGEAWLYVPYGVKRVTVRHAQLGTMTYEFPIPVAKARTYIMDLVAANVTVIVEQEITQQYVVFRLNPADAVVELDGKVLETRNGTAKKFVRFGKYQYTVTAKDYHPVSGEVEVRDAQSSTVVNVELKPAFGSLAFAADADLKGAVVFVDGEQAGTIPFSSALQVASGQHHLKIVRPTYKVYNGTFEIADGQNLTLSPKLEPNFATVTVSTLEGAEIVANGTVLGKAPWTGTLEYDSYSFENREPSHRTVYRTMEFFEGAPTQIALPEPLPIYGALDVDSDNIAKVSLDGTPMGETPCFIPKVLIGEHVVTLSAPGFRTVTKTVTVQEGKTEMVGETLVKGSPEPSNKAPYAPSYAAMPSTAKTTPATASTTQLNNNIFTAKPYGQGAYDVFPSGPWANGRTVGRRFGKLYWKDTGKNLGEEEYEKFLGKELYNEYSYGNAIYWYACFMNIFTVELIGGGVALLATDNVGWGVTCVFLGAACFIAEIWEYSIGISSINAVKDEYNSRVRNKKFDSFKIAPSLQKTFDNTYLMGATLSFRF